MARIIVDDVKAILDTGLANEDINTFIEIANRMVTTNLGGSGLGTSVLFDIERFLTAHLITYTRERQAKSQSLGAASITYTGVYGDGLDATSYGKTVKMLDTTGTLAKLGKKSMSIKAIKSFD